MSYTIPDATVKVGPEFEPEENHFPNNNPNASWLSKISVWSASSIILMNEFGIDVGKSITSGINSTKAAVNEVKNTTMQGINDWTRALNNGWPFR